MEIHSYTNKDLQVLQGPGLKDTRICMKLHSLEFHIDEPIMHFLAVLTTQPPPPLLMQAPTGPPPQILGPPHLGPDGTPLVTTMQPEVQIVTQSTLVPVSSSWGPPPSSVQVRCVTYQSSV